LPNNQDSEGRGMKREILCMKCVPKPMGLKLIDNQAGDPVLVDPYPGEHQKILRGFAKKQFICDRCGEVILVNQECLTSSIWADHGGIPYYPWETQYITFLRESTSV
jgi:hypothetical protein